jgi:glycosyltransferase involved in cell wall biosynthesis
MRRIVEENDLGAVTDPRDTDDLAAALRAVLDAPPAVREARRHRALELARSRYRWEVEVREYLALVAGGHSSRARMSTCSDSVSPTDQ